MASKQSKKKAIKKATKEPAAKKPAAKKPAAKKVAAKTATPKKVAPKKAAPKKRRKKSSKEKKAHYVNAKEFYQQICDYYKTGVLPDYLAESINKIAIGLSYAPNFINYSYKDDMIGDALIKMYSALKH